MEKEKEMLKNLVKEGRAFILSLEDADKTVNPATDLEYADVRRFKRAVELAAKVAFVWFLLVMPARAWEFSRNPDRFPSFGAHVDNEKLDGDRTEIVIDSIGQRHPYRNSDEREFTWRGGADIRLPVHQSITFGFMYERVETEWFYTRHNTLGGDLYEENRRLSGYNYKVDVRFYLNK